MSRYLKAGTLRDLPTNSVMAVDVAGHRIALFNIDEEIHAVDNICRECGTVLSDAIVTDEGVCCPHHGWTLDLDRGVCPVCPEHEIRTYPVKIEGDVILVKL